MVFLFTRIRTYSDHLLFILCMKTPHVLVTSHQSGATGLRLMYIVILDTYGVNNLYLSCSNFSVETYVVKDVATW